MPLLLVAEVRCRFGRRAASSKAKRSTRSTPTRVITVSCSTVSRSVPSKMRPPTLEYSPSVFSRTTTKSMSPGSRPASGLRTPGIRRQGRRFTYWSKVRRNCRRLPHKRDVVGDDRRPADGAEEDGVVGAAASPPSRAAASCRAAASTRRWRSRSCRSRRSGRTRSAVARSASSPAGRPPCRCRRRGSRRCGARTPSSGLLRGRARRAARPPCASSMARRSAVGRVARPQGPYQGAVAGVAVQAERVVRGHCRRSSARRSGGRRPGSARASGSAPGCAAQAFTVSLNSCMVSSSAVRCRSTFWPFRCR